MQRISIVLTVLFALTVLFPPTLGAGTIEERLARAEPIPPEEWRAMAMGRTLTYRIGGELFAMERYHAGTDRVTLQLADGTCLQGHWYVDGEAYCYAWEGLGTHCFRHVREGDDIFVIELGAIGLAWQEMSAVTDTPLQCGPAVTS